MIKKALIMTAISAVSMINSPKINATTDNTNKAIIENFIAQKITKTKYKQLLNTKVSELSIEQIRTTMLQYINEIRTKRGVNPLKQDKNVNMLSQRYSKYLYENNMDETIEISDHYNKEGHTVLYRAYKDPNIELDFDCEGCIAEMLVESSGTIKEAVDALIESTPHKKILLSDKFTHIGIGHKKNSNNIVLTSIRM